MSVPARAAVAACAFTALLLTAACGGDDDSGSGPVAWNKADVCGLLTGDEVASFLGERPEPRAAKEAGRPTCEWQRPDADNRVKLTLYQLPEVGRELFEQQRLRVMTVAGKQTYVAPSTAASCTLQIDGGQAFVAFEVSSPEPAGSPGAMCAKVATAGSSMLERLGW